MRQKESLTGQSQEIFDLLSEYSKALSLLEKYDSGTLAEPEGIPAKFVLKYEDCLEIIKVIKTELTAKNGAGSLFGSQRSGMFEGVIKNIYQTFDGRELYDTTSKKAAHLLYLVIKDHPFYDGNKRIGAFLFVYFLSKNNYLYNENEKNKIDNSALVALALLVAESNPKEKDAIIKIILNLL
ncbi:MAG: Fic family protein [Parcubacteria group bacterium]|nr:Fic family protein [Parcubacteria group bacterium]